MRLVLVLVVLLMLQLYGGEAISGDITIRSRSSSSMGH